MQRQLSMLTLSVPCMPLQVAAPCNAADPQSLARNAWEDNISAVQRELETSVQELESISTLETYARSRRGLAHYIRGRDCEAALGGVLLGLGRLEG
jgi:hypothetical protein